MSIIQRASLALVVSVTFAPINLHAQQEKKSANDQDDIPSAFSRARWSVHLDAGSNKHGRFILQNVALGGGGTGQRQLRADQGYSLGIGGGVDFLGQTGLRFGYSYGASDLRFRTDIGDGSELLDDDDVGQMQTHTGSIEVIRYMLRSTASVTPYGGAGFVATWYVLDPESPLVGSGDTQFRMGAVASLGVKARLSNHVDLRFDWSSASIRSPFTGNKSYRVATGTTIDEPTRVNNSSIRIIGVYNFTKSTSAYASERRSRRH
jgi:hypothetical protein